MPWGWIYAQINGDRRSTKVAKKIIVHWHSTFLRQGQVCFPMHLYEHLYGKIVENFGPLLLWSHWAKFAQILCGASLGWGNKRLQKMAAMPIYDQKTFKILLLQNQGGLGAKYLHKSSETGDLPKLLKWLLYFDIWPFYIKVMFASLCICMSPLHLIGKIVENFKELLLWSHWAKVAQIRYWAFLGRGNKRLLKWLWFIDQDGHYAHIW